MKPVPLMIAGLGLITAACGQVTAGSLGPAPAGHPRSASSSPAASGTRSPATSPSAGPGGATTPASGVSSTSPAGSSPARGVTGEVWLVRSGKLFVTERTWPYSKAVGQLALNAMLAGPSGAEVAAGLTTDIPPATGLLGLRIADGTATVDLSPAFESSASAAEVRLRLAQVVYTLTQFTSVRTVRFEIGGQARSVIGGVSVRAPQTRSLYGQLLPAITVSGPVIGTKVTSPVTVHGTADVFEAVVSVRVLDATGTEIARTLASASCGTGCRGSYSVSVPYTVTHAQPGTIEVFEVSAKSGLPVSIQSVPVTLQP